MMQITLRVAGWQRLLLLVGTLSLSLLARPVCAQTVHPDYEDGAAYVQIDPTKIHALTEFSVERHQNPLTQDIEFSPGLRELVERFGIYSIQNYAIIDHPVLKTFYTVYFSATKQAEDLVAAFAALPYIQMAERKEWLVSHRSWPNDFNLSQGWHLDRINALEAWGIADTFSNRREVRLAIVDDAVMTNHEDLQANIWINPGEIPGNGIDDDGNGFIDDVNGWDVANNNSNPNPPAAGVNTIYDFGHGTHVAGCAALVNNNNVGLSSVGDNWVKIIAIKATPDNTTSPQGGISAGYQGIQYAIAAKADVINCSWGGGVGGATSQATVRAAIEAGIVIFGSAGNNDRETASYPCAFPEVICVAASVASDEKEQFSDFGTKVDITAPGTLYSSYVNAARSTSVYSTQSGTSMSGPLAAGTGALLKSAMPTATPEQIRFLMRCGCENVDGVNSAYVNKLGAGRINAQRSFQCLKTVECGQQELTKFNSASATILTQENVGYLAGTNSNFYTRFAEQFDYHERMDRLHGVRIKFGVAQTTSAQDLSIRVWGPDANGKPSSTSLASQTIPFSTIAADIAADRYTEVLFATPIQVSTRFFVGVQAFPSADSFAIVTTPLGGGSSATAAWVSDGNDWLTFDEAYGNTTNYAVEAIVSPRENANLRPVVNYLVQNQQTGQVLFEAGGNPPINSRFTWDFGDGTPQRTTFDLSVNHTYASPGSYQVKLWVDDRLCAKMAADTVLINPSSRAEVGNEALNTLILYPNPTHGQLTLRWEETLGGTAQLEVLSLTGQQALRQSVQTTQGMNQLSIDLSELPSGVYLVRIAGSGSPQVARLIRQ
jgi:hypothetical protein